MLRQIHEIINRILTLISLNPRGGFNLKVVFGWGERREDEKKKEKKKRKIEEKMRFSLVGEKIGRTEDGEVEDLSPRLTIHFLFKLEKKKERKWTINIKIIPIILLFQITIRAK